MNVLPAKYSATEDDLGTLRGLLARLGVSSTQLVGAAVIAQCGSMELSSSATQRMPTDIDPPLARWHARLE